MHNRPLTGSLARWVTRRRRSLQAIAWYAVTLPAIAAVPAIKPVPGVILTANATTPYFYNFDGGFEGPDRAGQDLGPV